MLVKQQALGHPLQARFSFNHSADDFRRLVALLDNLIDEGGENEADPLASLMEMVEC